MALARTSTWGSRWSVGRASTMSRADRWATYTAAQRAGAAPSLTLSPPGPLATRCRHACARFGRLPLPRVPHVSPRGALYIFLPRDSYTPFPPPWIPQTRLQQPQTDLPRLYSHMPELLFSPSSPRPPNTRTQARTREEGAPGWWPPRGQIKCTLVGALSVG